MMILRQAGLTVLVDEILLLPVGAEASETDVEVVRCSNRDMLSCHRLHNRSALGHVKVVSNLIPCMSDG